MGRCMVSKLLAIGLFGILSVLSGCRSTAQPERPPNIVFVLVDDMGWTDSGTYGSKFYETPNIDRLAREGVKFTQAYAAASICSPTRASIMTGKHPARLQITDWIPGQGNQPNRKLLQVEDRDYLPREETTVAELLKEQGYTTAHMGKWHLGGEGYLPEDQGFDVNVAGNHRGSPPGYFYPYKRGDYQLEKLAATGQSGEHLTSRMGAEAAGFISAHKDEPFFLHLSYYAVHTPLQTKERLEEKYIAKAASMAMPDRPEVGQEHGHQARLVQRNPVFAGMVESMDRSVGQVLKAIEEAGVEEETVVVLFSDNGGLSTKVNSLPTANYPLRAGKGWLYEGGIREPLIVKWPGTTRPGSVVEEPVVSTDFFPTIAEIAGVSLTKQEPLDGVSLVPLLNQRQDTLGREALYWHYPHYHGGGNKPSGAIRKGDYKLIQYFEDNTLELYNLDKDLGEQHNLAEEMPGKTQELLEELNTWRQDVNAQMSKPNPQYAGR